MGKNNSNKTYTDWTGVAEKRKEYWSTQQKYWATKQEYWEEQNRKREKREKLTNTISILGIVLILLTVALLFSKFRNSESTPTFTSLLQWFSGFEAPEIPFITLQNALSLGDWTIAFNWLRDIIYFLAQVINVVVFIANGLIIAVVYIVHFCQWLFLV